MRPISWAAVLESQQTERLTMQNELLKKRVGLIGGLISTIVIVAFAVYLMVHDVPQNAASWIMWTVLDALLRCSRQQATLASCWVHTRSSPRHDHPSRKGNVALGSGGNDLCHRDGGRGDLLVEIWPQVGNRRLYDRHDDRCVSSHV